MNPLLLGALLSFGPGFLSSLFGDPRKKMEREARRISSPQAQGQLAHQFYQNQLGSPAYSQAQGAIAAGANQASNQVAQNLAARGIGTSGTAAVLSGLTPSLVGSQQAGLRTSAYQSAQGQAQNEIQRRLAALQGMSGPSNAQQHFAGGLEAFIPYLQALLSGRSGLPMNALNNEMASGFNPLPSPRG